MKPSIRQISEITGFSVATISNALNHKKGVNKDTSEVIFRIAREIGYLDNSTISKIKLLIYKKNGLIIDDTPFFTALIDGLEKECRESGYEMMVGTLDRRQPSYEDELKQAVNDSDTAIVLLGTELCPEDLKEFYGAHCPILLLDYWDYDMEFNAVVINNEDSIRKAVRYLLEKGHQKIGYLKGDFRIRGFKQRERGFWEAMRAGGHPVDPQLVVTLNTTMDGAYRSMSEYLAGSPILPTAYIAENDMIALGAMRALDAHGFKVPEDISIIGFDDLPFCEISYPRLTSLRVPKQEMGALAIRHLIEMVKKESPVCTKTEVCTEFVERDSVKTLI
ncbi:MAG: LacI family DNA-binding transcriptional regulator [Hungatella sp.]